MSNSDGRPTSDTRVRLWQHFTVLVLLVVVATGSSYWFFRSVHDTDVAIRERTGPMIVDVSIAQKALMAANIAATRSFLYGHAGLAGPGQEYYNQMAIAGQSLAQAAEVNAVGAAGTEAVQTVNSLLASYSDAISQAAAHARAGDEEMATAALWSAGRQLHDVPGGIIERLHKLQGVQREMLQEQAWVAALVSTEPKEWLRLSGLLPPPGVVVLIVPPLLVLCLVSNVALLLALVVAQRFMRRRFRRRFNAGLIVATGLVLLTMVGCGYLTYISMHRIDAAQRSLLAVLPPDLPRSEEPSADDWLQATLLEPPELKPDQLLARDREAIAQQLDKICSVHAGECGATAQRLLAQGPLADQATEYVDTGPDYTESDRRVRSELEAATFWGWLEWSIPSGGLAIAGCAVWGFWRRFDEYRFGRS
ncbi:hypothetical protein MOQ72_40405 [Saccharopolyspora sp. K220]|uniref:hypothetical protein n=1 Tax=Saccharopolyspora soli TaxID=2926618 RepID=UPI001F591887|nr:hypothetical protein [Saccharopolyspora soli]MCI2423687.1 hypothetical protein [Saccharopolyspora soli]